MRHKLKKNLEIRTMKNQSHKKISDIKNYNNSCSEMKYNGVVTSCLMMIILAILFYGGHCGNSFSLDFFLFILVNVSDFLFNAFCIFRRSWLCWAVRERELFFWRKMRTSSSDMLFSSLSSWSSTTSLRYGIIKKQAISALIAS